MSREEFMRELEYLLSDIPDEEKVDAIEYYKDYLEEAGQENEEAVIKEFGSPERVAAMIRSNITGNLVDGGEFTDNGYQDERFRDPNYQMAKRYDLPEVSETDEKYEKRESFEPADKENKNGKAIKIVIWIILIIVASPLLIGMGGSLAGLLVGLIGVLIAVAASIGAITLAFFAAAVAAAVAGIASMILHPLSGILLLGCGILFLGLAFVSLAVSGVFYGKFLPFLFRSSINFINSLLHGRRDHS